MYETFYGLREKPFSLVPDPDFLYLSRLHRAALNMLEYGLQGEASFTLISGEVGSGKTILVRRFLRMVTDDVTVGVVTNTPRDKGSVLEWILLAFGLEYRDKGDIEQYETFMQFLQEQQEQGYRTILIIDEAHNLTASSLEELRMLSNINVDNILALQVILVGQPEILENLNKRELRQLAQRISVNFKLLPLTFPETRGYIRHRLRVVDGDPEIFDSESCAVVHILSGGLPRLINVICDSALVYGFGEGKQSLDAETIFAVATDMSRGGLRNMPGLTADFTVDSILKKAADLCETLGPDDDETQPVPIETHPREEKKPPAPVAVVPDSPKKSKAAGSRPRNSAPMTSKDKKSPADGGSPVEVIEAPKVENVSRKWSKGAKIAVIGLLAAGALSAGLFWHFRSELASFAPIRSLLSDARREEATSTPQSPPASSTANGVRTGSNEISIAPALAADSTAPLLEGGEGTPEAIAIEGEPAPSTPPMPQSGTTQPQEPVTPEVVSALEVATDSDRPETSPSLPALGQPEAATPAPEPEPDPVLVVGIPPTDATAAIPTNLTDFIASDSYGGFGGAVEELFAMWRLDFSSLPGTSPCKKAQAGGLACYERDGSLIRLARLKRPAVITLNREDGRVAYAVVTTVTESEVTLKFGDHSVSASRSNVEAALGGSFLMLWRAPEAYRGIMREGRSGQDVAWLRKMLDQVMPEEFQPGDGTDFDADLVRSVRQFQETNNLYVDGIVGIETMILLNSAAPPGFVPRL